VTKPGCDPDDVLAEVMGEVEFVAGAGRVLPGKKRR
jgi:hypothetical protein